MIRSMAPAIAALLKPKVLLVAENLCLRQQLIVLQHRQPRPWLHPADRQFWIQARRCWLSMSAISTAGGHTGGLINARPVHGRSSPGATPVPI